MNTTHKVSIGGMAFVVEESAFNELKTYIDRLENHFRVRPDGNEIVADIEARIAELLNGKLLNPEQLVTIADIRDVLSQVGDPAEMEDGAEQPERPSDSQSYYEPRATRRLYRSIDNKIVGGVCSGIASYLNTDPVWVRILFVALTIVGSPIAFGWAIPLIYVILWVSLPVAVTVAQKLEMEGKPINVNTIEQRIREEASNVAPHVRSFMDRFLLVMVILIKIFAGFILSVFVVAGLCVSLALLVTLFGFAPAFMGDFMGLHDQSIDALMNLGYFYISDFFWFKLSVLALIFIPTILLIALGIKLIFKSRIRIRFIAIPLTIIWVVALFAALTTGAISLSKTFGNNGSVKNTIVAPAPIDTLKIGYSGSVNLRSNDMLVTLQNRENWNDNDESWNDNDGWNEKRGFSVIAAEKVNDVKVNSRSIVYVRPFVNVEFDDSIKAPKVLVKKWATGQNYNLATQAAEDIEFTAAFKGDSLLISPATKIEVKDRIVRGVELTVLVPKGKTYTISRDMLSSVRNIHSKRINGVYHFSWNYSSDSEDDEVSYVDTVVVK